MKSKLGKNAAKQQSMLKKAIRNGLPLAGLFAALPLAGCGENVPAIAIDGDIAPVTENRQTTAPTRGTVAVTPTIPPTAGVPLPPPPKLPEQTEVYTVKSGDTLGKIAQKYGSSVEILKQLNKLSDVQSNKLQEGQKIVVPQKTNQKNESTATPVILGKPMSQDQK